MCTGAAWWARTDRIVFAATRADAAAAGFDDAEIYEELSRPLPARKLPVLREESRDKKARRLSPSGCGCRTRRRINSLSARKAVFLAG